MEKVYNAIKGQTLQHWLKIAIKRDENGDATVELRSTIHVNRVSTLSFSWGKEFTDADILNDADLLRVIYQKYGREIFTAEFTRNI
ncbi:hypothetical protein PCY83_004078 [Salmonella enterica]|uniref:DUF7300 domain-containing protein n=4 Tax=root TaxID=1 RepID=A0A7T8EJR3_9CAUD|nr:hypothetical protein HWB83_gp64 [Salmonella phage Siskin]EAX8474237.1 hypothetical protein [Salmonella enterica]EDA1401326.1 hypothetical protein [Salmonella enterica subsp. enterica serovar Sandiego]EEJ3362190.1 hypothetical protein [Salmonella enterica subsp. enterica serovar Hadar]QMV34354.1 hypothetical protein [Salmonella phage vB_SentM_sal2]QMV34431.1 hypothetical protein [Salmonella phage vB_SentM_sal3]QQO86903.1 hypothetical protein JIPKCDKL_00020 [Salmonella phage vB_SenS_BPS2]QQ